MSAEKVKLHFDNVYFESPMKYSTILLYQTGDCITKKGFIIEDHKQYCDEISYIVSGNAQFVLDGESYSVSAGDLFFCPEGSVHKIITSPENPMRYFYLGYHLDKESPDYLRWEKINNTLKDQPLPICHRAFNINQLFCEMFCEIQQDFSMRDMIIEMSICQILLHTCRAFTHSAENMAVYGQNLPSKEELAYKIVNYIDSNVLSIKSLADVGEYIGFSYSYTSQIFASVMNMSINDYYQKKRFEQAEKLLKNGISITQTSDILGFDSSQSFSRAFKTRYGISPRKYIESKDHKIS